MKRISDIRYRISDIGYSLGIEGDALLKKELLEILCCPKCKGELLYEPEKNTLTCKSCKTVYPVKNDIPIMLVNDDK